MKLVDVLKKLVPIKGVKDVHDDIEAYRQNGLPTGFSLGWPGFDACLTVLPGQLCILSGVPGSGKTELMETIAINQAAQYGWRTLFYSPENYPLGRHVSKIIHKSIGRRVSGLTDEELARAEDLLARHFNFIEVNEDFYSFEQLLYTVDYEAKHSGRRWDNVVIDPWNELEHGRPAGKSETDYIGDCLMRARRLARKWGFCFWILPHPVKQNRQKDGAIPEPTPYDLSGSQHWYNKADVLITGHRTFEQKKSDTGEAKVTLWKVKDTHYGRVGEYLFILDRDSMMYEYGGDYARIDNDRAFGGGNFAPDGRRPHGSVLRWQGVD